MRPTAVMLFAAGLAVLAASYFFGPYSRSDGQHHAGGGETAPAAEDSERIVSAAGR